ncbi:MAG TPA: virulence protein RhuM/Fic/DOC family protein [Chitinophagaceae bacterium]|jgi:death-on-curing family protein|nr:virulence protein RhuM/Fic/DOC family protein [Chitinophagaceae bacterium]
MQAIEIYKTKDGQTQIEVKFEEDTVWLTQEQITKLFQRERTVITKHINNIFKEGELDKKSNVQKMHIPNSDKPVSFYNLDVIISVGYRVKSKRGIQFRQWATQRLRDYLVKGYAINQQRLDQLEQVVKIIQKSGDAKQLNAQETRGLLEIITNYTQSFILLNRFDSQSLPEEKLNENITYEIDYNDAAKAIEELKKQLVKRKEASELFGMQKNKSFNGILKTIVQTFDNKYLYPSIEEQAAHLLYFVIKNHPFTDGNKRVGAFLFVWFLEKNKHRFKKSGEVKINDNALVALALLVAQSDPSDKELMIKLIMNLINDK